MDVKSYRDQLGWLATAFLFIDGAATVATSRDKCRVLLDRARKLLSEIDTVKLPKMGPTYWDQIQEAVLVAMMKRVIQRLQEILESVGFLHIFNYTHSPCVNLYDLSMTLFDSSIHLCFALLLFNLVNKQTKERVKIIYKSEKPSNHKTNIEGIEAENCQYLNGSHLLFLIITCSNWVATILDIISVKHYIFFQMINKIVR